MITEIAQIEIHPGQEQIDGRDSSRVVHVVAAAPVAPLDLSTWGPMADGAGLAH
ncbi:hypothetical protein ACFY8O_14945 [Streptomyces argenteolus]|uniref:Uncharacterized protein n=1 Tax=Streptomyces argenteolus TaxID=67274 RepID=A0ABW6X5C9_9ACTN